MDVVRPPTAGTYTHAPTKGVMTQCQRSGFMFPYEQMVKEPGTGLWVHRKYSDGQYNRVQHRNHKPVQPEPQHIPNVFPPQNPGLIVYDWLIDHDGNYIEMNAAGDFVSTGL